MTHDEITTFLYHAGLEFDWLVQKLGGEPFSTQAHYMTNLLAREIRATQQLWDCAKQEKL